MSIHHAFHTLEELHIIRNDLMIRLAGAKEVPDFPPVEFKINYALIRDLQENLDRVNSVIQGRETLPI